MCSVSARSKPHEPKGYRPEIDGLRAIAVLSVVLYHFGVPGLRGGFVGVDVFFVLSGFLIGGILWRELEETGRLSLGRFYQRRFKRLAPAFFTVAFVSFAAAYLWLLPFEFREFGKSLIAATVYLSNVQFFREAGYFDIGADEKLLLHTWSLAVEEQFYVFLPLVMLFLARSQRALIGLLTAGFVLSLFACVALTPSSPTATFFLFPFRAWELLAGVLLAIWGQRKGSDWRLHPAFSWIGMALILGGLIFTRAGAGFPGWQVIPTVLGTVLVLANGQDQNPVNALLRTRSAVFVGLISYSLYLWHWPVAVLSLYVRGSYAGVAEVAGWIALSAGLAVLSWRFVERPTRHSDWLTLPRTLGAVAAASVVALALGAWAFKTNGLPDRYPAEVRTHIAASGDFLQDWSRCSTATEGPFEGVETCAVGPEGPPEVLFWGDSHLRALMDGIAAVAHDTEVPGLVVWHAGCPPLFDISKRESAATPAQDADCFADTTALRQALPAMGLRDVVLVGRWAYYAEGAGTGRDAENRITLLPEGDQAARFEAALAKTVTELSESAEVHILRQVPEVPQYDSRQTARDLAHGRAAGVSETFTTDLAEVEARQASSDGAVLSSGASILDPRPYFCTDDCSVMQDGQSLYFDNNHLTNAGAYHLAPIFLPVLEGAP